MNKNLKNFHMNCPHFKMCSGCSINDHVEEPPIYLEAKFYFQEKGIANFSLHVGNINEWRYRAKLAIRGNWENPLIGLFEEGTHNVLDIPLCKAHHPRINQAVSMLKRMIREEKMSLYNERTNQGALRYIQLHVERETGKVQLSLVLNMKDFAEIKLSELEAINKLWGLGNDFWHSIWLNFNTTKTNVIFGLNWKHLYGEPLLWEKFDQTAVCFQPSSFFQANPVAFGGLLQDLKNEIQSMDAVVDYYSGVGVIGLSLAEKCEKVVCCEVNSQSSYCFEQSKARLPKEVANKISFYSGSANDFVHLIQEATLVIVDPPRKGLELKFREILAKSQNLRNFCYVSCGWESFKRDCDFFLKMGWKIKLANGYLFFPGTNHIEVLVVFEKAI